MFKGMNMNDTTHLVDGKYGISDLVDMADLRRIFERFTEATGFTIGFLDHPGLNILIATGWRDICTKFHRGHSVSEANCIKSNKHLLNNLDEPGKLMIEQCENGLVDCAFPIFVKGKHIANLATGQMLLKKPDLEQFRRQAKLFGFDEHEYMKALGEVSVVSEEKLRSVTMFLGELALLFSQIGYARLVIKEDAERLEKEIAIRKTTEQSLAEEKERLLVTLRCIGDGVITTNTRGQIVLMNKVAEDLTGWLLSESTGRPLSDVFTIINKKTRKPCENPVEKILCSKQNVGLANYTVLVCRNGQELFIAASSAAIRDQSGNIIGVVLVFRDLTDRQKAEEALHNAQKLQSLGILAGGIAHDFNNYLGGILGHVDLAIHIAKDGELTQSVNELTQVSSIIAKAKNLTQRLLTFAKGEMPVMKLGSIAEVVREIATFSTSGSNVVLKFHANPNIPNCSFDENQIARVIQNLVLNANQAMPDGGTVQVSVEQELVKAHPVMPLGSYVKISVRDNGYGIPAEIIPHIFDPFVTTKPSGNGLGLAICYSIVKKHNGYIEVTSHLKKGSEFILYFPAVMQTQQATEDRQLEPESIHQKHGTVLVMDDEESILTTTSRMLQRMGYDTISVKDGTEVLKILNEKPFQLIILDLTIPGGMGGVETVREIRRRHPADIIVVAMSGYSEAQGISDPKDCAFDASIAKPFTMEELTSLLNKVVQQHSDTSDYPGAD
ncbi:MAG: PocR ligand-binding domain-containing protein [Candidatus Aureabacteria bacterium]|nr:PocR ligand-binding domain-containing protein [Candidatus Auribacterota bacterium]